MTSLAWSPSRARDVWRLPLIAVVALMLFVLFRYRETAAAMVEIWIRSETFTHAFVVPPIVLWLIWRKRGELAAIQPRPLPWMLLPMAGLAAVWWLGHRIDAASAMQLAMTAMIVAAVPLVLGAQVTRALIFPLAFAFFAVPIGDFLTPTLMYWTAEVLVAWLRLTGIPVYQEGQQLVIPSGRWAVVEACGGIRYLMATFMVGSLFAYLNYRSSRRRLIFVAVSLALPVLANWVRAYIIVMLGHLSNNEIATGADHLVYGWVFFGVVILGLFFVGARWAEPDAPAAGAGSTLPGRAPDASAWPWPTAVVAVAAALAVQWPLWVPEGPSDDTALPPLALPESLGSWQAEGLASQDWVPAFSPPSDRQARRYRGPNGDVTVHVAHYRGQRGEGKLVTSANRLIDGKDHRWHVYTQGKASTGADGRAITWRTATLLGDETAVRPGLERPTLTVWQVYWIDGRPVPDDIEAKLLQAWLAVRGRPDDGAVIHLVSSLPDGAAASAQLSGFVAENFGMLQRSLTPVRPGR